MNESYRATLIVVGLTLAVAIASWRLLQIEANGRREPPQAVAAPHVRPAPLPREPEVRPTVHTPVANTVADLIDAAQRGDVVAILNLAHKGANINGADQNGLTPLLAAIGKGSATPELIQKLLKAGADATLRDAQGRDALSLAVERDDVNSIVALLTASSKLAGKAAGALIAAAGHNHVEAMKAMIDNGVDVNAADKHGRTALASAVQEADPETVQFLLEHSADPNHKNADGMNALMLAAARGKRDIVQAVIEKIGNINDRNAGGETALMQAARASNAEVVKTLVDAGSDVNAVDFDMATPLMAAASAGQNETVQLLLEKGADVHAKDSHGHTAYMLARNSGYPETADLIAKAGGSEDGQ